MSPLLRCIVLSSLVLAAIGGLGVKIVDPLTDENTGNRAVEIETRNESAPFSLRGAWRDIGRHRALEIPTTREENRTVLSEAPTIPTTDQSHFSASELAPRLPVARATANGLMSATTPDDPSSIIEPSADHAEAPVQQHDEAHAASGQPESPGKQERSEKFAAVSDTATSALQELTRAEPPASAAMERPHAVRKATATSASPRARKRSTRQRLTTPAQRPNVHAHLGHAPLSPALKRVFRDLDYSNP